jgi:hypothetical protein
MPVFWIRDPVPLYPWIRDPGWVKKLGSGSVIRIRDEQPGPYFRVLRNSFWVNILSFMRIQDPGSGINIPDPQQCP